MFLRTVQLAISVAVLLSTASAQDGPASVYWAAQKTAATDRLVGAFNQIASHAGQLRVAMAPSDADGFDAVMLDVMGALASLPGIAWKEEHAPATVRPAEARPGRISQLQPEVEALVRFFERLKNSAGSRPNQKLFANAEKSARKMGASLPDTLPTVSSLASRRR
jgi:ABC-type enterochelin transport system substrate-binding protein